METDWVLVVVLALYVPFRLLPVDRYAASHSYVRKCVVLYLVDFFDLDKVGYTLAVNVIYSPIHKLWTR